MAEACGVDKWQWTHGPKGNSASVHSPVWCRGNHADTVSCDGAGGWVHSRTAGCSRAARLLVFPYLSRVQSEYMVLAFIMITKCY